MASHLNEWQNELKQYFVQHDINCSLWKFFFPLAFLGHLQYIFMCEMKWNGIMLGRLATKTAYTFLTGQFASWENFFTFSCVSLFPGLASAICIRHFCIDFYIRHCTTFKLPFICRWFLFKAFILWKISRIFPSNVSIRFQMKSTSNHCGEWWIPELDRHGGIERACRQTITWNHIAWMKFLREK